MPTNQILSTERLSMRELSESDIDFVSDMLSDERVMRHYPKRLTRDESLAWIARMKERYARDGCGLWAVEELATDELVGQVGVLLQEVDEEVLTEVGYLLHQDHWGRGFAREAAAACFDYAFSIRGCERVVSMIRPENERSRAVAKRLGLSVLRRTHWRGYAHDIHYLDRMHWKRMKDDPGREQNRARGA